MTEASAPERTLAAIIEALRDLHGSFALIGGLAVSVRGAVRFTRDVDLAIRTTDDSTAEKLIFELRSRSYSPVATVEHKTHKRLATARLASPHGVVVDLMFASCGIEDVVIDRATPLELPNVGRLPVAAAEELTARPPRSGASR